MRPNTWNCEDHASPPSESAGFLFCLLSNSAFFHPRPMQAILASPFIPLVKYSMISISPLAGHPPFTPMSTHAGPPEARNWYPSFPRHYKTSILPCHCFTLVLNTWKQCIQFAARFFFQSVLPQLINWVWVFKLIFRCPAPSYSQQSHFFAIRQLPRLGTLNSWLRHNPFSKRQFRSNRVAPLFTVYFHRPRAIWITSRRFQPGNIFPVAPATQRNEKIDCRLSLPEGLL